METALLCGKEEESVEHMLLFCEWTKPIWFGSQLQCIPDKNLIASLYGWLGQFNISFQDHKEYRSYILKVGFCNLWFIQKNRNKAVFEKTNPNPMEVTIKTNALISELQFVDPPQRTLMCQIPIFRIIGGPLAGESSRLTQIPALTVSQKWVVWA